MKNKWSANNVKAVGAWLQKRWPALFTPGPDRQPLALDIHKEILSFRSELPELSRRTLDEALKRHMTSYGYLYGMSCHSHRVDLSGNKVTPVSDGHRAWAAQELRKKQKEAQRASKQRRKKPVKGNRGQKPAFLENSPARSPARRSAGVSPGANNPVIRYKQRRRRVVPRSTPVEMAG